VLVKDIAGDELGLGYFGLAVYEGSKDTLKILAVDAGQGAVLPSPATVQGGTYKPLARPLFLYVSRSALDRPEVSSFLSYYVDHASELTSAAKYVPLSTALYSATKQRATARVTGSVFYGGSSVNVTFDDLLAGETDGGARNDAAR
jgi:phosphate transport system substrate-binding protein